VRACVCVCVCERACICVVIYMGVDMCMCMCVYVCVYACVIRGEQVVYATTTFDMTVLVRTICVRHDMKLYLQIQLHSYVVHKLYLQTQSCRIYKHSHVAFTNTVMSHTSCICTNTVMSHT